MLRGAMLDGHNRARAIVGVPPLVWDERLAGDAAAYAAELARTGRFQHAEQPQKPVAFVDVQQMIVNLATEPKAGDRQRFLKFKVSLEVKDPKAVAAVEPLLPRVEDIFQVFVRELRASDLEGSGGIHRLREELLRRVNVAVAPTRVDAVLFKEVIVQ